jgi:predicted metal-binding membrane protein
MFDGGGMPMPGGWTMSMAWMRMPGQSWPASAAMFMAMWIGMMVPMMLPSLVPMVWRYRRALRRAGAARLAGPTALVAAGYFAFWSLAGAAVYPIGVALAAAEMSSRALARAVPIATVSVVLLAGAAQLTRWKARHLARCRTEPDCGGCGGGQAAANARHAWRHGLRLGLHCCLCCSGYMAILLVCGVMDPGIMAAVALAITVERLAPYPAALARVGGAAVMVAGAVALFRALRS